MRLILIAAALLLFFLFFLHDGFSRRQSWNPLAREEIRDQMLDFVHGHRIGWKALGETAPRMKSVPFRPHLLPPTLSRYMDSEALD